MRLLDLFCGAGGAARGYQLAGFHVTGIDVKPQPHYVGDVFIQADALAYVAEHGWEFDVIHASPPCQRYSISTPKKCRAAHPDLIASARDALQEVGKPYVIENVTGARKLLHNPIMLCGTMFELPIWRHRYFEIFPPLNVLLPPCRHDFVPVLISGTTRRKGVRRMDTPVAIRRTAMGCDWMTTKELDEAIPPAYTEWIGHRLQEMMR